MVDLPTIQEAFCKGTYLFKPTATAKILWKQGLRAEDLKAAICDDAPEILERYPNDPRGPACLVLGWAVLSPQPRPGPTLQMVQPLHVVVGYGCMPGMDIEVITAYQPDGRHWQTPRVRRT